MPGQSSDYVKKPDNYNFCDQLTKKYTVGLLQVRMVAPEPLGT